MIILLFNILFVQQNCKKIIDHISRLEGQLASIKRELQRNEIDCSKASKVLLAASRSFATLRLNFVKTFLATKYQLDTDNDKSKTLEDLLAIVKG